MRRRITVLFVLLAAAPAFAQGDGPDGARVTAPALPAPNLAAPNLAAPDPSTLDPGRLSASPVDAAYAAYQLGYYLTALERATPLALAGNAAAQTLIGEIYMQGLGVRRDIATATEWYQKAAEQGVPEAIFQLAMISLDGGEEFGDGERAWQLMRQAADAGHRIAQFNYAEMIMGRDASVGGEARAVDYYEKAAKAGLGSAQYAMAQARRAGAGGRPRDDAEARRWLEESARQGYAAAQIELGSWLVESGAEKSEKDGFAWLMRAATAGNPVAQNRLAKLYRAGIGVEPDRVAAAMWYLRARRAGLTDTVMEDQLDGLTEEELRLATLNSDRLQ